MVHYVFMKYKPGYLTDEKFLELAGMFTAAVSAVDGLSGCVVKRNTVERDTNMDLMVTFSYGNVAQLAAYIKHPLHLAIAAESGPHETARFSFDCES